MRINWHRHLNHRFSVALYPCGCESVACLDCNVTDGRIDPDCNPGQLGYTHPALTSRDSKGYQK